jgi:hypothetical protein
MMVVFEGGYTSPNSSVILRGLASGEIQPLCRARVTAWALSLAFSFRRMALTWFLIVCSLIDRMLAISLFVLPSAT